MFSFIDRKAFENLDITLLTLTGMVMVAGLMGLYSATHIQWGVSYEAIFRRQLLWMGIGLLVLIGTLCFSYGQLKRWAYVIYVIVIIMLIAVLLLGKHVQGARRWLAFGPFAIQPSEMAKLSVVIVISRLASDSWELKSKGLPMGKSLIGLGLTFLPAGLVLVQPDLGSAILIISIGLSLLLLMKMKIRIILILLLALCLSGPIIWTHLKDYQKARVMTFINPELDPTGAGYHINQSKIAIGSGQVLGKGFKQGTQTRLHYLPEHYTDFIFSVIAEEWGFVGGIVLMTIYVLLILRCLSIGMGGKDAFGYGLSMGAALILFWHTTINLGMVTGLLPVVGVPLLFVSYGGSSLLTGMAALGLTLNVYMRRFVHKSY